MTPSVNMGLGLCLYFPWDDYTHIIMPKPDYKTLITLMLFIFLDDDVPVTFLTKPGQCGRVHGLFKGLSDLSPKWIVGPRNVTWLGFITIPIHALWRR